MILNMKLSATSLTIRSYWKARDNMTESEAIKILKKDSCYECAQGTDSPLNCEYGGCRVAKATRVAIQALEEVQLSFFNILIASLSVILSLAFQ